MIGDERTYITPERMAQQIDELRREMAGLKSELHLMRRHFVDFMLVMAGLTFVGVALFALYIAATL